MQIHSPLIGDVNVEEKQIYTFAQGIPGFESVHRFAFIPLGGDSPFTVIQAVEQTVPSFIAINPFTVFPDYDFHLPDYVAEQLELVGLEDVELFSIVTLGKTLVDSTCNLMAPVVLNRRKRTGKQVVLEENYSRKAPLVKKGEE